MNRDTTKTYRLTWEGHEITVTHTPDYFSPRPGSNFPRDHLEVTVEPARPLPFTATGYRSHFLNPDELAAGGGPVEYVRRWLDEAAQDPKWIAAEQARRQFTLF